MIKNTKIIEIAGVANNGAIGKNNELVISTKEDMRTFREMTTGKILYMGYNTLYSFPKHEPLPNRDHIIITSKNLQSTTTKTGNSLTYIHGIDELEKILEEKRIPELVIVGGARVYRDMYKYTDEMILTEFDLSITDADAFFPDINYEEWDIQTIAELKELTIEGKQVSYKRKIYTRKK